jgi:DNA-binding CsgD family transcriptional regulator
VRQLEVLHLLMQGLNNGEVAAHLSTSPKTIEHYVSAILAKLREHSRTEAVAYALAHGLIAPGELETRQEGRSAASALPTSQPTRRAGVERGVHAGLPCMLDPACRECYNSYG